MGYITEHRGRRQHVFVPGTGQFHNSTCIRTRAGTNTPSDKYDSYREYRVANTNMYSRIHFSQRLLI